MPTLGRTSQSAHPAREGCPPVSIPGVLSPQMTVSSDGLGRVTSGELHRYRFQPHERAISLISSLC